jgi:hypothetical protein
MGKAYIGLPFGGSRVRYLAARLGIPLNPLDIAAGQRNHAASCCNGWGGPMRGLKFAFVAAASIAALAGPAVAAGSNGFFVRVGDLTAENGKVDKKSGQQWIPIVSWEWGEYVVEKGAPPVISDLHPQGYYDKGSLLVNAKVNGCQPGKKIPEAVLKTPGMRYTFTDVTITDCDPTDLTFNYGAIRTSASW